MKDFRLMDWTQLDDVSYDEVDKILIHYEEAYVIVEARLEKIGSLDDPATYDNFVSFLSELPKTKEVKRRIAIAKQIREKHIKENES